MITSPPASWHSKTINLPVGDHSAFSQFVVWLDSTRRCFPSSRERKIWNSPRSKLVKAKTLAVGRPGRREFREVPARDLPSPLPSAFITYTAWVSRAVPVAENAIRRPSGDHAADLTSVMPAGVTSRRPDPSAALTKMWPPFGAFPPRSRMYRIAPFRPG